MVRTSQRIIAFLFFLSIIVVIYTVSSQKSAISKEADLAPTFKYVGFDKTGSYKTIQTALDDLDAKSDNLVIIHIAAGKYAEKIYLTRDNVTLIGAGRNKTILEVATLRKNWRKTHDDDWGAAVVNIKARDITLLDMTISNPYGDLHGDHDHQFAVRAFPPSTRIITDGCRLYASGGDTLSLWNKKNGMYYHSNCHFEGYVDMVCPRGWALIQNSSFHSKGGDATIWHDGQLDESQKLVITNSSFSGVKNFTLARRHYDAQFYILNSRFSKNIGDIAPYRKTYNNKNQTRANLWGDRYYFSGADFENGAARWKSGRPIWAQDNFLTSKTPPPKTDIDKWVFNGKWFPIKKLKEIRKLIQQQGF